MNRSRANILARLVKRAHPVVLRRLLGPAVVAAHVLLPSSAGLAAAGADASPGFAVRMVAPRVAARSNRRPVAAGLYDPAVDRTFITWAGKRADNYIQAFDHASGQWSAPVAVGAGEADPHNYPTLAQAADGRLLVFRGMHNRRLEMARSARPHAIEGEWEQRVIAEGAFATYPMPFTTSDGRLFVFYRKTCWFEDPAAARDTRPICYVMSTDHGRTWQNSQRLTGDAFALGSIDRHDHLNEIYIGQLRLEPARSETRERVSLVYTLAGGGPSSHQHDRYHRNIYFAYFDPADLHFYSAAGADLGTQVDDAEQERDLKVADTPLGWQLFARSPEYISLAGTLGNGRPFLIWLTIDDGLGFQDHMAVWNGQGWELTRPERGLFPLDMEPVDDHTWRLYAARAQVFSFPSHTQAGLETWRIRDGRAWELEQRIPLERPVQHVEVISGYRDPVRFLVTGSSTSRDLEKADGDLLIGGK